MTAPEAAGEWQGADPLAAEQVLELARTADVGLAGGLQLALLYVSRRSRRGTATVSLAGGGRVCLSRRTLDSDWQTLREIFLPRKTPYATDYRGAVVLDVGAHKGYFGAWALLRGAGAVLSYEPAAENHAHLERAASSFRRRGRTWVTRRAAVGARAGEGSLRVSAESWTHSLHAELPPDGPAREVATERVEVVSIGTALTEAAGLGPGARLIVKVDAEGAECELCRETPSSLWAGVSELFVETHGFAPCGAAELGAALAGAGLEPVELRASVLYLARAPQDRLGSTPTTSRPSS